MSADYEAAFPAIVEIVVEIPRGSRNKYEFDEEAGVFRLNRILSSAVFYNFDYGFIEGTLAEDGDEADILVLIEEPTFSGCLMEAKPIGMLLMRDEKGPDNKVLGVAVGDPRWRYVEDIHDVPPHLLNEIENFFLTYKRLEAKVVTSEGWEDAQKTKEYLNASVV